MSTEIQVDDETRAAMLLFNERVEAAAKAERAAKRIAKATRAKDEAAALVRTLGDNPNASAEEKAAAESAYKAAVESFNTIQADPTAGDERKPPPKAAKAEPADEEPAAEEPAGKEPALEEQAPEVAAEASQNDDSPSETSSDEEEPAQAVETTSESE